MKRISVIVPNYNGREVLPACLESLARQCRPPDEIIVVDDASTDDSADEVGRRFPWVQVIVQSHNGGFCRAANAGLRAAGGDYLALLNNDAEADPTWLEALEEALERRPDIGFCASKMLFYDQRERINSAGLFMRVDGVGRDIGYGQLDGPQFSIEREVFGACGGAAIYRRVMLEDVGLFDETFVAYAEDLDLSFRAQWRGYRCLYVPKARVYHRGRFTYRPDSPLAVYYSSRNMLAVILKNMPASLLIRYGPRILAAQIYQVCYYTRHYRGRAAWSGKWATLRSLRQILEQRKSIMAQRRVSEDYIASLLAKKMEQSFHFK